MNYKQYHCKKCFKWKLALYPEGLGRDCYNDKHGVQVIVKPKSEIMAHRKRVLEVKRNKALMSARAEKLKKILEGV